MWGENDRLVRVSVRDEGIGIPADKVEAIFDPFTQVDDSESRRFGGTGLGLTICRQLVELMGYRASVDLTEGPTARITRLSGWSKGCSGATSSQ